jgi:dolichol-phosphate mannosyltransferase
MTSNFFLNKVWTFEDRSFEKKRTMMQYFMFMGLSSIGALLQLSIVYILYDANNVGLPIALIIGVAIASVGNFLLNKKLTFKERIWG